MALYWGTERRAHCLIVRVHAPVPLTCNEDAILPARLSPMNGGTPVDPLVYRACRFPGAFPLFSRLLARCRACGANGFSAARNSICTGVPSSPNPTRTAFDK
jgi:hypothetical protein